MTNALIAAATTVMLLPLGALPTRAEGNIATSPYAGQQTRAIKSLSQDDLKQLRQGEGWGLAKPAELNGVPGPAHLLELASEIGLSDDQISRIEAVQGRMKDAAIEKGAELIAAEMAIEAFFQNKGQSQEALRALLERAEKARAELRFVHLSAHLDTPGMLTRHQIATYIKLRGYDQKAQDHSGH